MRYHVIIVAGGSGLRMQAAVPKQFLLLRGLPVLMHTINRFHQTLPSAQLIVVLPEDQISFWKQLLVEHHFSVPHQVVAGGETRFHSVKNGLAKIDAGIVGVHDGVSACERANYFTLFFCRRNNGSGCSGDARK